jgi:ABC-type transport system involved in multi-copper enzyme maturation permease subunit
MRPSLVEAALLYAEMTWRRGSRVRRAAAALVVALLPALIAAVGVAGGRWGRGWLDESLEIYLRFLLPFAPVLATAQLVSDEVEARTYTYLWARPAPRAALVLGKWALHSIVLLPSFLCGVVLTYVVALARDPSGFGESLPHLLRVMGGVALGVPLYTALAAGIGTLLARRPLIAAFLYILIVEELFGTVPGALKIVAISFYVRTLAGLSLGATPGIWEPQPGPLLAVVIGVGIGAAWLLVGIWLIRDAEYRDAR